MGEEIVLLQKDEKVTIVYSDKETSAVKIAVSNLKSDIHKVFGCRVEMRRLEDGISSSGKNIVIATLGAGGAGEESVLSEHGLRIRLLSDKEEQLRWEGYLQQIAGGAFYIVGTDRRGTVFGIYDFCEQIGVSPWYYWADVPAKRKEYFKVAADYCKVDWPAVPYRGIFLNDEEELDAWSKRHTKDGTIGPETYGRIFELILRLKGNYIWPAMHVNCFNSNPENGRLAEEMGIVVGTSHCDMMLRSNQNEWIPWLKGKGYQDIRYDYSIKGKNREKIQEYWKESVEMNRDYEVCYTVGMRGIHDSGFITEEIDEDLSLTPEEKKAKKVKLLEQVIEDQRQILRDVLGERDGKNAVQTFIPYKEVLELYDRGVKIPDDVTLIWVDDNFGYMRRYPTEAERGRKGGNGLYYHASYWAAPGMSYLFFNSIPLAHTGNELKKCWESGIRKMWVLNVGALKPLEVDTEFFLWYGWNAGKGGEKPDAAAFTAQWINKNFSGNYGGAAAEYYNQCMQLTNVCKLEHMRSDKFSQTAYGDEGKRRLDCMEALCMKASEIYFRLPAEERDAFYEMILMKMHASYYVNASFYYADRSRLSFKRGAMQAADHYLELSRTMDDRKRRLLCYYNKEVAGGKWDEILTPESFSPPPTVLYPAGKPALVIGRSELGMEPLEKLEFSAFGEEKKVFVVFNKGRGETKFCCEGPEWLEIMPKRGSVSKEQKIEVRIRREQRSISFQKGAAGRLLICGENGERFLVPLQCLKNEIREGDLEEKCYVEADGFISIPADGFQSKSGADENGWHVISGLGRGWGNAVEAGHKGAFEQNLMGAPKLEYRFYLQSRGSFLLEIYRFLTLNSTGRIRFAIGVDRIPPVLLSSQTVDEWTGNWKNAVMDNGEKLYLRLPYLQPGMHTLSLYMVDQYVTLTKLVIYTGKRLRSNLGPDISNGGKGCGRINLAAETEGGMAWEKTEREIYGCADERVKPLPVLYADKEFWKTDRLYVKSDELPQDIPGDAKYQYGADGGKNIFREFGKGIFTEEGGRLSIEAEYALENTENAYLTPDILEEKVYWSHTQAETDGRAGLAMMIEKPGLTWEKPELAPGMHYRISISETGKYYIWLLVKFEDTGSDACCLALDGKIQESSKQFSGGSLFTYSMKQRWNWQVISAMEIAAGVHTFSVLGKKSGLRIDRIYITAGEEWPPVDQEWKACKRIEG